MSGKLVAVKSLIDQAKNMLDHVVDAHSDLTYFGEIVDTQGLLNDASEAITTVIKEAML